tara:strand:+ start:826 stop:1599 length:774 start_codon:yes stop_codon:yes gene_type:complete
MNEIAIYKKPLLAVLADDKKLRSYLPEEILMQSKKIVQTLLITLGVGDKADTNHHVTAIKYLAENCGQYSVREIQHAFTLAIGGKLEIELFQQLNVLVIGKVLAAFEKHKRERLRVYNLNNAFKKQDAKMTEQDKIFYINQAIDKQFSYFLKNRSVDASRIYVYDIFDKMGLMPTDLDYKNSVKKDAIEILKNEYSQKKATYKEEYSEIKKQLKNLDTGTSDLIIVKCKELALLDFLRKQDSNSIEALKNKLLKGNI